jgi:hypothetical protein
VRRIFFFATALFAAGGAGAAACSFPNVPVFADDVLGADGAVDGTTNPGDGADDDASSADGATEAATDSGGEILIDGSSPDALIVKDAGQAIDASGCAANDCDCDKDTYKSTGKAGCSGGSNDCDDNDPRRHPNQGYLEAPAGPAQGGGDWDCNGTAEPLYKTSVTCAGLTLGLGCADIFGFSDVPLCGQTGTFIRCKGSLLTLACSVGTTEMKIQPCK